MRSKMEIAGAAAIQMIEEVIRILIESKVKGEGIKMLNLAEEEIQKTIRRQKDENPK